MDSPLEDEIRYLIEDYLKNRWDEMEFNFKNINVVE